MFKTLLTIGLLTVAVCAGEAETLRKQVESLRAPDVKWRKIEWRSCLLEGLRESRRQKKPIALWIFIDRPIDDARC